MMTAAAAGHAEASAALRALARAHRLPVTTTLMALGCFPADDPLWLGMLGMHGTRPANWAIDEADLVVALGARFDDRVTGEVASFAPGAKIVHVDLDAAEISKIVPAHVPVVGDARRALEAIGAELDRIAPDAGRLAPWWARLEAWRAEHGPRAALHGDRVDPEAALDALSGGSGVDRLGRLRLADPAAKWPFYWRLGDVDSISAADPHTVVYKLKRPHAELLVDPRHTGFVIQRTLLRTLALLAVMPMRSTMAAEHSTSQPVRLNRCSQRDCVKNQPISTITDTAHSTPIIVLL